MNQFYSLFVIAVIPGEKVRCVLSYHFLCMVECCLCMCLFLWSFHIPFSVWFCIFFLLHICGHTLWAYKCVYVASFCVHMNQSRNCEVASKYWVQITPYPKKLEPKKNHSTELKEHSWTLNTDFPISSFYNILCMLLNTFFKIFFCNSKYDCSSYIISTNWFIF